MIPPVKTNLPVDIPLSFSESGVTSSPDQWWYNFNNKDLNGLIELALEDNLTIKSGWARIKKAEALRTKSRVSQRITANASLTTAMNDTKLLGLVKTYGLSVPASYEVDLFNKLQDLTDAAGSDILTSQYTLESIAQTLASNVGETWFNLLRTNRELDLSNKQIELNATYLELMEIRFAQGQANALDIYQQRQQLANTQLLVPGIKMEKELLKNQLALLLGKAPGTIKIPDPQALPTLPDLPETGLPIDLLDNRPDVKQAFSKLVAANSRLGAAIKQRKPSLKITGEPGFGATNPADLFAGFLCKLGASLLAPIVDGGRIRADISLNKAEVEDLLNQYGQTMINAIGEVEDALIKEKYQKENIIRIKESLEITNATLREAKLRYMNGLSDYLPSISALTTLQALERQLVLSVQKLLSHRISLYRALGGHWSAELTPPSTEESRATVTIESTAAVVNELTTQPTKLKANRTEESTAKTGDLN
jgi:NodT family efflux transporter outer membrane factor (OMF) lipoprotein